MRKEYELKKVLEELARSRNIELSRLTPQELIKRGRQLYEDFEFNVYSCISFPNSYYKDGFVLLGEQNGLSILYLGQQRGKNEYYGHGTGLKSRIVHHPSELAIVEDPKRRADLSSNPWHTTIRIRDKALEQAINDAKGCNSKARVESYSGALKTESENLAFLQKLLEQIF